MRIILVTPMATYNAQTPLTGDHPMSNHLRLRAYQIRRKRYAREHYQAQHKLSRLPNGGPRMR